MFFGSVVIFTARAMLSVVYAVALSVCVYVTVTSQCSTKMAKSRKMQMMLHDSSGTVIFKRCQMHVE